jgi:hypothetical protein
VFKINAIINLNNFNFSFKKKNNMNINLLIPPSASPRPQSRGQSRAVGGPSRAQGAGGEKDVGQLYKDRFSAINTAKT